MMLPRPNLDNWVHIMAGPGGQVGSHEEARRKGSVEVNTTMSCMAELGKTWSELGGAFWRGRTRT